MIIKNSEHYSRKVVEPKSQRLRELIGEYLAVSFSTTEAEPGAIEHVEHLISATHDDIIECGITCKDCKHYRGSPSLCLQYGQLSSGMTRICYFYFELAVVEHKPFQLF